MENDRAIPISDVPGIVETMTGQTISRQTAYNWVKRGWLKTLPHRPFRTTPCYVENCVANHKWTGN